MSYIGRKPQVGNYQTCDSLTASSTATYNLTVGGVAVSPISAHHCLVSLNGILQAPISSYTISGSTIVFASSLSSSDSIDFITILGNTLDTGTPSDGTVTTAKLASTSVTGAKINNDIISAQTALTSLPADTDELLISDAGTIKRLDFSLTRGMDKLAATAVSSDVASVTFDVNHNNDSTFNNYSHYILYIANFLGDGSDGELKFRIGVSDSSDIKTADYMNQLFQYKPNAGSTIIAGADTNAGDIRMGNDVDFDNSSRPMFGEVHFYRKGNVGSSYKPAAYGFFYAENTNGYFGTWHFHGSYEVAVDTNYVQIVPSTGNIAKGEFTLFGVRNT